jgi:rhodanese-related sulfurtransferase
MAGAAALAGALAPLVGSPYRRATAASPAAGLDIAALAREVADADDHVSAVELATWLRARRPGLRVIDVRTASEYAAFHVPTAEHVPLDQLAAARFGAGETLVLYSELGVHGGQAWVLLRALGHRRVWFLRGGLVEWLDDVMSPTIAADAPPEAQARFAAVAELSRWFGGTPRRIAAGATATAPEMVSETAARRRGC